MVSLKYYLKQSSLHRNIVVIEITDSFNTKLLYMKCFLENLLQDISFTCYEHNSAHSIVTPRQFIAITIDR